MSTIRVPLRIPRSLSESRNFKVKFSLHNLIRDDESFIDKVYKVSELTPSPRLDGTFTAQLQRAKLPRWKDTEGEREDEGCDAVELRAHFWQGWKCVGSIGCGIIENAAPKNPMYDQYDDSEEDEEVFGIGRFR
ncbi:hypothetical protein K504DRAFT_508731 [Pleomassaria siparia CBS 279.74]|uniref:Uncharacterized protein n=1 Tax=Pleomassaria siparia CBS 279.74 TaxID=1314801 RepID=A0A6G1JQJ3_9PLEO|nr:hypothetical protein K504DRAFT_508731 [Pleomassaria siparia CBS 279.74]